MFNQGCILLAHEGQLHRAVQLVPLARAASADRRVVALLAVAVDSSSGLEMLTSNN